MNMILTPQEEVRFLTFKKYYAFLLLLDNMGAFDIKNGSLTINFDKDGRIGSVDRNEHYRVA